MFKTLRLAFLAAAIGVVSIANSGAHAQTILSNLPGTSTGSGSNLGLGTDLVDRTKAVGLTTGASALQFGSLDALISNIGFAAPADPADLSGGIYDSVAGNPGTLLSAFDPVNVAGEFAAAEVSITTASPYTLAANTSYWFVLDGPGISNSLSWDSLTSNMEPVGTGVTYDGYRFSSDGGAGWGASGIFNGVRISVVPEPQGLLMISFGLALFALRSRK